MKKGSLIVGIMLASVSLIAQQLPQKRTASFALGFQGTQPIGQFAEFYSGVPLGLYTNLSIPVKHSPFEIGGAFAWNRMDSDKKDVSVVVGEDMAGEDVYNHGTIRIRSNTYRYHAIARIRPLTGKFQVYGDALIGAQSFTTSTDIQIDNSGYTSATDSQVDHRDFALNIGWAAGLRIRLNNSVFLEGRFEKIEGGRAKYVDPQSMHINRRGDDVTFDTKESRTNQCTYQVGIVVQF